MISDNERLVGQINDSGCWMEKESLAAHTMVKESLDRRYLVTCRGGNWFLATAYTRSWLSPKPITGEVIFILMARAERDLRWLARYS